MANPHSLAAPAANRASLFERIRPRFHGFKKCIGLSSMKAVGAGQVPIVLIRRQLVGRVSRYCECPVPCVIAQLASLRRYCVASANAAPLRSEDETDGAGENGCAISTPPKSVLK